MAPGTTPQPTPEPSPNPWDARSSGDLVMPGILTVAQVVRALHQHYPHTYCSDFEVMHDGSVYSGVRVLGLQGLDECRDALRRVLPSLRNSDEIVLGGFSFSQSGKGWELILHDDATPSGAPWLKLLSASNGKVPFRWNQGDAAHVAVVLSENGFLASRDFAQVESNPHYPGIEVCEVKDDGVGARMLGALISEILDRDDFGALRVGRLVRDAAGNISLVLGMSPFWHTEPKVSVGECSSALRLGPSLLHVSLSRVQAQRLKIGLPEVRAKLEEARTTLGQLGISLPTVACALAKLPDTAVLRVRSSFDKSFMIERTVRRPAVDLDRSQLLTEVHKRAVQYALELASNLDTLKDVKQ